jgi:eukaryotic-like serine/threonine-protein kinase
MRALHAGSNLDHYHIESLVARSGMASIFRAIDTRTGKPVALKVPHPEMECDLVFFERFHREETIGKRLDHPGVVKVFSEERHDTVYMVMEWVEGRPLREILQQQKKLSVDRALRIALQICDVLGYIHSHGVIHRDLKPENIMVDGEDRIKLIDFGIAASTGARRITFARLTPSMGTPDYISPEQIKGKRGDARSDFYALGVILYEMLTGQVPFQGANPILIMNDRLVNNPVPPRELNPAVSPQLQETMYRALERDPRNRYGTASEFALDLLHPERVGVADRPELVKWQQRREPLSKKVLLYVALAIVPIVVFALMIYVARL